MQQSRIKNKSESFISTRNLQSLSKNDPCNILTSDTYYQESFNLLNNSSNDDVCSYSSSDDFYQESINAFHDTNECWFEFDDSICEDTKAQINDKCANSDSDSPIVKELR